MMSLVTYRTKAAPAGIILIIALISYVLSSAFFCHLHRLPDGRIIVHSHAVQGHSQRSSAHSHSQSGFIAKNVTTSFEFDAFVFEPMNFHYLVHIEDLPEKSSFHFEFILSVSANRAPPVLPA